MVCSMISNPDMVCALAGGGPFSGLSSMKQEMFIDSKQFPNSPRLACYKTDPPPRAGCFLRDVLQGKPSQPQRGSMSSMCQAYFEAVCLGAARQPVLGTASMTSNMMPR